MGTRDPLEELHWLNENPRFEELMERFPEVWEAAGQEIIAAGQTGHSQRLNEAALKAKAAAEAWKNRIRKSHNNPKVIEAAVQQIVKSRLIIMALEKGYLAAAAGRVSGKVRFNLINGFIIQKLLFSRHLTRKPASLRWVKFWWPLLTQRRLLMPLVQSKGIYCFYSKELVRALADMVAGRSCVEIAAGDGTLARFLSEAGVSIRATDDLSWKHTIDYPENVENLDAKDSLTKYQPQVVICSWPPPANTFERHVFAAKSVELYIVIGSQYKFVSGNWELYSEQSQFEWHIDEPLSSYVIPPKSGNAVLIFKRKAP